MDQQFLQWAAGQAGLGIVAVAVLWMWWKDRTQSDLHNTEREERLIAVIGQQQAIFDTLIRTLNANADASARLGEAVKGLEKVVSNCALAQRVWERSR